MQSILGKNDKLFFKTITLLFIALLPSLHQLLYFIRKTSFWLYPQLEMHCLCNLVIISKSSFSQNVLQRFRHIIITESKVRAILRMFKIRSFNLQMMSRGAADICGHTLSWWRRTPLDKSPLRWLHCDAFIFSFNSVLHQALFSFTLSFFFFFV